MAKNIAVYGIYPTRLNLQEGVDALKAAGFRTEDISVLVPENEGSKDIAVQKHTKAPEGMSAGVISGAILGGALGWLVGTGMIAMPGIGPALMNGPVLVILAGIGVCGIIGAILGALIGASQPEYEARRFEGRIRGRGGILLSVHCDDGKWARRAREILLDTGAGGIASSREARADYARTEKPLPRTRPEARLGETEEERRHRAA